MVSPHFHNHLTISLYNAQTPSTKGIRIVRWSFATSLYTSLTPPYAERVRLFFCERNSQKLNRNFWIIHDHFFLHSCVIASRAIGKRVVRCYVRRPANTSLCQTPICRAFAACIVRWGGLPRNTVGKVKTRINIRFLHKHARDLYWYR